MLRLLVATQFVHERLLLVLAQRQRHAHVRLKSSVSCVVFRDNYICVFCFSHTQYRDSCCGRGGVHCNCEHTGWLLLLQAQEALPHSRRHPKPFNDARRRRRWLRRQRTTDAVGADDAAVQHGRLQLQCVQWPESGDEHQHCRQLVEHRQCLNIATTNDIDNIDI